MLKPKRVITKKEIERDPFLESVNKIQIHFQDRRSDYMKIALGLIVVLIGFSIVSENTSEMIQRRELPEDLLRNDILPDRFLAKGS